jgi:hypothetical protein
MAKAAAKTKVKRTKVFQPKWRYVIFGAIVLLALGWGLLAAFASGWNHGYDAAVSDATSSQQVSN